MQYAELLVKSHYSFLRGASHPEELVNRAAELGLYGFGVSDRDGLYGMPKAYRAIKEHPQMKFIVGAELTLEGCPHLNLIATSRQGYGLLCRLLTSSHAGKPKGEAALSFLEFLHGVRAHPGLDNLIAIPEEDLAPVGSFYSQLREVFQDRVYIPLSRLLDGQDERRTQTALSLHREFGFQIIATNQVHYHIQKRSALQDVLAATRENVTLRDAGYRLFSNGERYLKSPAQMSQLFRDLPEALFNTIRIADQCRFSPNELRYHYPSEYIPRGETAMSYLRKCTHNGAHTRYPTGVPEKVIKQIEHEFALIEKKEYADYFLTIYEIVKFARAKEILCQGRGSAANSAVCYCLGITAVDPDKTNLLFERFISAERDEPPDIDVDFEHERREEVIQEVYRRYSRDNAGMVAALVTYREKSAIRDVKRALGDDFTSERAIPLIEEIMGFPRHLSIHSGGFTLSALPMIETVPIEPARMVDRTIVQWDKDDLDFIGLLKVDLLALGMLTAIRRCIDLVKPKAHIDIARLPVDEKETYDMICRGDTAGVFQIESRAQIAMTHRMQPREFYDLVIQIAIVRPGPIVGQMVNPFLRRRDGKESSASPIPELDKILARTNGVPIFQEQVMQIAVDLAGFTPGEADELRRAIAAWRSKGSVEKMGRKLREGLLKKGLTEEYAKRVEDQIQGFAQYGFPESHSASFAILAYASAYLKCHYPAEFACALVNSQPLGFYANHTLVDEAKRAGVRVLPVDLNRSEWDCFMADGNTIQLGFRIVNGLSEEACVRLTQERKLSTFQTIEDFLSRARLKPAVLQTLAMGDAFTIFGLKQREALWSILAHQSLNAVSSAPLPPSQLSLFDQHEDNAKVAFPALSGYQVVESDYSAYGLSVRAHPMTALRKDPRFSRQIPPATTQGLKRTYAHLLSVTDRHEAMQRGEKVLEAPHIQLAGMVIVRQRPQTAKGTVFATLEDEEGFFDLILHEKIYARFREVFNAGPLIIASGRIQREKSAFNLIVRSIKSISTPSDEREIRDFSRNFR